jgi:predicted RNA-binding Zn ribbon-like protein
LLVMKKQQQAPGELELVRAFVNTLDLDQGTEALGSPANLSEWLSERGLAATGVAVTPAQLRHAKDLREALRAILLSHGDRSATPADAWQTLDAEARRTALQVRFDARGAVVIEPGADGADGAIGRLLAIVHGAIAQDTWRRLKACRLDSCEWAFYDHTKNRSGAWCDMASCGNRAKARAYRERQVGTKA